MSDILNKPSLVKMLKFQIKFDNSFVLESPNDNKSALFQVMALYKNRGQGIIWINVRQY